MSERSRRRRSVSRSSESQDRDRDRDGDRRDRDRGRRDRDRERDRDRRGDKDSRSRDRVREREKDRERDREHRDSRDRKRREDSRSKLSARDDRRDRESRKEYRDDETRSSKRDRSISPDERPSERDSFSSTSQGQKRTRSDNDHNFESAPRIHEKKASSLEQQLLLKHIEDESDRLLHDFLEQVHKDNSDALPRWCLESDKLFIDSRLAGQDLTAKIQHLRTMRKERELLSQMPASESANSEAESKPDPEKVDKEDAPQIVQHESDTMSVQSHHSKSSHASSKASESLQLDSDEDEKVGMTGDDDDDEDFDLYGDLAGAMAVTHSDDDESEAEDKDEQPQENMTEKSVLATAAGVSDGIDVNETMASGVATDGQSSFVRSLPALPAYTVPYVLHNTSMHKFAFLAKAVQGQSFTVRLLNGNLEKLRGMLQKSASSQSQ